MTLVETWAPCDDSGRPLARYGPPHLITETFVRRNVRLALALPEEERRAFWLKRRAAMARKLYENGLEEDEVAAALRAFNTRARLEAVVRRLLNRVEAETATEGGDP
ncbi:hypothetical protein [Aureimonas pseudogalii]|uniref:Uncharacterized protein n=1 Tax=Aureimonas pseudogalii TaxID=1744844 RepID=A0A7W6MJS5_9HYPH|nr:hypothetical protein [Aureimonas pseudogalii]MBB3998624.1 hypothetical protein [Aureimonas pseudogalii]